jgi:hypothetical protein
MYEGEGYGEAIEEISVLHDTRVGPGWEAIDAQQQWIAERVQEM